MKQNEHVTIPISPLGGLAFKSPPSDPCSSKSLVVFAGSSCDQEELEKRGGLLSSRRDIVFLPTDLLRGRDSAPTRQRILTAWLKKAKRMTSADFVHLVVKDAAIPLGLNLALLSPLSFSSLTLIEEYNWKNGDHLFQTF